MISRSKSDTLFLLSLIPVAIVVVGILVLFLIVVLTNSIESLSRFGVELFTRSVWDPEREDYGVLAPVLGTFITSLIATGFSLLFSVPLSVFVAEYLRGKLKDVFLSLVELMGGIPTIIYAVWALNYLAPFMKATVMEPLHAYLGFIPIFSCRPVTGLSVLTAGVSIGISLIPYMSSVVAEAYRLVPVIYKEACLGIGASRYETTKTMLSIIRPAILASTVLGFARAAGETTIAVTTVGNAMYVSACVLGPGYTVSALIASQYANANLYRFAESVLYSAALVVLVSTLILSFVGLRVLESWRARIVV